MIYYNGYRLSADTNGGYFNAKSTAQIKYLPGKYIFTQYGWNPDDAAFLFSIDLSGNVQYADDLSSFLKGKNSSHLIIDGCAENVTNNLSLK